MTREEMEELVADCRSLSDKIRTLGDAGVARADIARFLDRRYQHVRNVLNAHEQQKTGGAVCEPGDRTKPDAVLQLVLTKGSIKLPAGWLADQELTDGNTVICRIGSDGLHVMTRDAAIAAMAEVARRRMPQEAAMLEALLRGSTSTD